MQKLSQGIAVSEYVRRGMVFRLKKIGYIIHHDREERAPVHWNYQNMRLIIITIHSMSYSWKLN